MKQLSRRALMIAASGAAWMRGADQDPGWRTRVAPAVEPGERLVIRGRVLRSAGGPAAGGTSIMVYQTDVTGIYSTKQGSPRDVARLRGRFVTGPNGEYEILTIRPGPYPGDGPPAHIHVNVVEPGKEPREIFEFFFAGDPRLRGNEKGYVLRLRKESDGTWLAVQDVAIN